ncbi:MAG: translesion error-prone DNA polymerase V autoproteolytic subunit [Cyanobacteriota bacterium]
MKQKKFLDKLIELYGKEPLPSYDQICQDFGFKSKNSIWQYMQKLIEDSLIIAKNNYLLISPELLGISFYDEGLRAGFPSPAEDYPVKKISFDEMLIRQPESTYTVRVVGDSMIEAGIYENDMVIVDRSLTPRNGDIVVARVDGEFTMKFYKKTATEILLEPANVNYPTIKPEKELEIFGVVTSVVRKIKN